MKKLALLALTLPALLIWLIFYIGNAVYVSEGIDLNLFDTSIKLTYWLVVVPYGLLAFFFFSLFAAMKTRFKVSTFNVLLFISAAGILLIGIQSLVILLR